MGFEVVNGKHLNIKKMSVKFIPVPRINPRDLNAPKQYYAYLERGDDVSFDELIGFIGKLSGINEPYIVAVLRTLEKVIIQATLNYISQNFHSDLSQYCGKVLYRRGVT